MVIRESLTMETTLIILICLGLNAWQSIRLDRAIAKMEAAMNEKVIWPEGLDKAKWLTE
jgi:high-affinity Fe2+/Pb2+ permease